MRPEPKTMSLDHLLDDYLNVYRDGGRRHGKIRDEIERRFAALERAVAAAEPCCDALRDIAGDGHSGYLDAWAAAKEAADG